MKYHLWCLIGLLILSSSFGFSQNWLPQEVYVETQKDSLFGTLLLPSGKIDTSQTVVLIIAGSGPTDRNGNNSFMENNSLKLLAEELAKFDIASLRYDKRGVGSSVNAYIKEEDLRFQNNVEDALYWVTVLYNFGYRKIIVAGHSEGALVATMATEQSEKITKLVLVAGTGRPIDVVLKEQYAKMSPLIRDSAYVVIDSLKKQHLVPRLSPWLFSVFRPSVQPYIISWMQIDPAAELAKVTVPALIIQGTTDIQVGVIDAQELQKQNPAAKLVIINEMNHVLKKVTDDKEKNRATYSNPTLPLHPETDAAYYIVY